MPAIVLPADVVALAMDTVTRAGGAYSPDATQTVWRAQLLKVLPRWYRYHIRSHAELPPAFVRTFSPLSAHHSSDRLTGVSYAPGTILAEIRHPEHLYFPTAASRASHPRLNGRSADRIPPPPPSTASATSTPPERPLYSAAMRDSSCLAGIDTDHRNCSCLSQTLAVDLLNPSTEQQARCHKLKRLVQNPNSFFMDVKCPGCFAITTVFSHAQTVVVCGSCAQVLSQPTGGKARLTEGCSFRKKA